VFGEIRNVDLIPNGGNIPVTNENREQYVELYVGYIMDESVDQQFRAFEEGFRRVSVLKPNSRLLLRMRVPKRKGF
jgi:hypothetical protein